MTPSVLIRRAAVGGSTVDVRCANGVITHVGTGASAADVVIDAEGGGLIPGLHDHHIHLLALAAARTSVPAGPPEVTDAGSFDAALSAADRRAPAGEWLRVVGYHEAIAGELDRRRLDALVGDRPTRVQHATGSMWVLNGAALARTSLEEVIDTGVERDESGRATGRIFGLDALVRERVGSTVPDLAAVGQELAGYGVTSVTDLTPTEASDEVGSLADQVLAAGFPLGVVVTGGPGLAPTAGPDLARGPVKFRLVDHRLPALDELVAAFCRAHRCRAPGRRPLRHARRARARRRRPRRRRDGRRRSRRARRRRPDRARPDAGRARCRRRDPAVLRPRARRPLPLRGRRWRRHRPLAVRLADRGRCRCGGGHRRSVRPR